MHIGKNVGSAYNQFFPENKLFRFQQGPSFRFRMGHFKLAHLPFGILFPRITRLLVFLGLGSPFLWFAGLFLVGAQQLDQVVQGVFDLGTKLMGIRFWT